MKKLRGGYALVLLTVLFSCRYTARSANHSIWGDGRYASLGTLFIEPLSN
jgi:hypothetical protein